MVRLNRIYTRTGDDGTTGLVDGSRVAKHDPRMVAIGDVDEANSVVGWARLARTEPANNAVDAMLAAMQNDLFDLGADIATPGEDFTPSEMTLRIVADQVARLERTIDTLNDGLEPLRSFILPGGTEAAARIHIARAAMRRAERSAVAAADSVALNPLALAWLNRASDLLFVLARRINADTGAGDVLWVPGGQRSDTARDL